MGLFSAIVIRVKSVITLLRIQPFDMSTTIGREKERHRRLLLSSVTAALAKLTSVSTALISVPLTIRYLGTERYGMWITMTSFIAMLSFADLGMGNGLLNAVAHAHGVGDRVAIRRLTSSAYFALSTLAIVLGVATFCAFHFVHWPRVFNVESDLAKSEATSVMAVLFVAFTLAIPLGIIQRIQVGLQQGFSASLWQCVSSIFTIIALLTALYLKAGLPWLAITLVGVPLMTNVLNSCVYFGMQARDIMPALSLASRNDILQITRTGALFLVLQIVGAFAFNSDNVIIAQLLGASRVAEYAVPAQMFNMVTTVIGMGLSPLWPAYGEAIARGDHYWVKRTLIKSVIISVIAATVASGILLLMGNILLKVWVGNIIFPSICLMLCIGIWKVVETGGNAVAMFLNGANVVRVQIILATTMGAAAILFKFCLVPRFGLVGIPLATIVAYLLFTVIPLIYFLPQLLRGQANKRADEQ